MALGKISVKLTPKMTNIEGTDHIFFFEVLLVGNGPGTSAITAKKQEAIIEFFEEGDKSTVLATITAEIKLKDDKKIEFDLNAATFQRFVSQTDFTLDATFNSESFKSRMDFTLKLPWKVPKSEHLSVGAQLKIAGAVEVAAFSTAADKLDVPLKHEKVPDPDEVDDAGDPIRSTCFGVGVVYPEENELGVKMSSSKIEVLLHSSVKARCDAIESGQFDLASIQTHLATIFSTGGFSSAKVTQPTDAKVEQDWKLHGNRFFSKTVASPPDFFDGDGHLVPFFQYLFSAAAVNMGTTLAEAESLTEPKAKKVIKSKKKKRVIQAGIIFAGGTSGFATGFKLAEDKDHKNKFIANVLAHEIGHALGLRHGLEVVRGGYAITESVGLMTGLISKKKPDLIAPGPVHARVLKNLYS